MGRETTREKLLVAARKVFVAKGYHDAKIDDIAELAGVGKGTFYLYFEDKRAVFAELVDGLFERLSASILRVDSRADIAAQVRHNIRAVIAVLLAEPELTRLLLSYASGLDPAFLKKIRSFYDGVRVLIETTLAEGQKMGIVAQGDPRLFALWSIGALKEVLLDFAVHGTQRPREELVDALFSLAQRGFLRIPESVATATAAPVVEGAAEARPRARRKK